MFLQILTVNYREENERTCHDSGDCRRDSVAEELEGVGGNFFRSNSVFRLSSGSHHARFQEDTCVRRW